MAEHIQQTMRLIQQQVAEMESQLAEKKRMVNSLCDLDGQPHIYSSADVDAGNAVSSNIRSDEFYGQPLSTVVRLILEKRKAANQGAASVGEIYDAMTSGGYDFGKTSESNSKRNLRISLTKNSSTFHRLPGKLYGLLSWYPNVKTDKDSENEGKRVMQQEFGQQPDEEEVAVE